GPGDNPQHSGPPTPQTRNSARADSKGRPERRRVPSLDGLRPGSPSSERGKVPATAPQLPSWCDTLPPHMKAIAYDKYGSFDVLALRDIDKPAVKDGEVLVRVRAAALQIGDCFGVRGAPYMMRMYTGLLKPKYGVPGYDFAGQVEAVGNGATQFKPGDEVFGSSQAACAEYAVAREDQLAPKPANVSVEEAAAIPTAALTALRGPRDVGRVQAGQNVLINGASGGVGHFAVQIAKALGAEVTGVCSAKNLEMVRSIGADHVIDYTKE